MHDPLWMRAFLAVHITAGASAFVLAPAALVTAKGGKAHRRWGKVYLWAMGVVCLTALVMALYRPVLFLALVAVFSFYAAFGAYRVLRRKSAYQGQETTSAVDWTAAGFAFLSSAALALLGVLRPAVVQHMTVPAVVFGIIGMWLAGSSMWSFTHRPTEKMFWWYEHLQGMIGSYIAAWTAFLVVTVAPRMGGAWAGGWWIWLVPTAIGVPASIATTAYYKRKFAPRLKAA